MKKSLFSVLTAILLLLALTACGSTAPAPAPTAAPATSAPTSAPPAPTLSSVLPGSNLQPAESGSPVEETPAVGDTMFKAALACVDQDVSALYAAIGEPEDSSYASSCIGEGEDGELYYDGFTVATYREGDKEIVRDVNLNAG